MSDNIPWVTCTDCFFTYAGAHKCERGSLLGIKACSEKHILLWNLINEYVVSCNGDPSKNVYGNIKRMEVVSKIEKLLRSDSEISNDILISVQYLLTTIGCWTNSRWDQHIRYMLSDERANQVIEFLESNFHLSTYAMQRVKSVLR